MKMMSRFLWHLTREHEQSGGFAGNASVTLVFLWRETFPRRFRESNLRWSSSCSVTFVASAHFGHGVWGGFGVVVFWG